MKSILRKMVAVFCLMVAMVATVDAQSSFAYQAVIRTANGEVVSEKKVSMRFSLKYNNKVVYSETHQPTTSKYGNVEVKVGEGQKVSGDFAKVPWHTMQVMMQIEADPNGGTNYIDLGAIQLQPAPYAMHAASTGLVVDSSSPKSGSGALFEVKDKDGNPVFAVYPDGVRVYVDDADGKAMATGFAVAGRRAAKDGEEANLFSVTSEGTQVTVDDAEGKAMATGFAVAGRRAAKDADAELFTVNSTGTQVYINTDADGKAMATGFAVAGRRAAKDGETDKYLEINESGTQIYIDDDAEGKPIATGFAVAGRRAAKGNNKYMEVTADGTTVYVGADGKAMATGFAVAGRRAAKGKKLELFEVNEYGTHIYIDADDDDKPMATGFAVAGRRAAKDGSPEKYMVIDADGTIIYVDYDDAKAMQTGFAVAGRRAAKDGAPSSILTVSNHDGTHVYIDDAEGKAMQTGFAVAGRRAAKDGQYIMQITDKSALMVTQNLMIDDKESNKSMMTMTTEGTVIKTENFVVAKDVENSDGTMEETSVFQATPEQGVQIAAESKVVVKGDVAQNIKAEAIEATLQPIEVYSQITTVKCNDYAKILGEVSGYKLLKIRGNGVFTENKTFDKEGNAVVMYTMDGNVTQESNSAAVVVILKDPESYDDAELIIWPCRQINSLNINFGLMAEDSKGEYLDIDVIVNSKGAISNIELLSSNEDMGTVELNGTPAYNSIVSAVAKPKPGFEFDGWGMGDGEYNVEWVDEETGDTLGYWSFEDWRNSNPYNFAVGFDSVKLTALFQPIRVSYFADPQEGGKIEVKQKCDDCETTINNVVVKLDYFTTPASSEGSFDYVPLSEENDSLTFVAIPEEGYKFAYWSIGWNDEEKITDPELTVKVDHSMEIVAYFVQDIDGPEKFGNSVGNDENKKFNEWYTEFYTVESSESGVDDEGAYVKFKTVDVDVDGGGFPYNAQFNNILKGLPGQNVGNRFTLSFEAKWEPDKDVYGENAPGAAKLYLKTGKKINDGDSYQWVEGENTELLDEEGQIFKEIYPKVINNEWNRYVWEAIIGEAGENFNDDYGMGAQIGIEMDLIDGGLNSGTFRFRNITVSIYDENSGQQYSATYFEKKVAQEQPKRLIEIAEPIVEGNNSPLITIYAPDNTKLEPYFSEETEINTIPCRLYTYYAQISDNSGTNFQFKTNEGDLNLYRFTSTELNEYSKITSNKLTFEDFDEHKAGGKSYNETGKYYVFNQPITLDGNRFVAMFGEENDNGGKATIDIKVTGYGEVEITEVDSNNDIVQQYTLIGGQNGSYECIIGNSVYLNADAENYNFYGWFNDDGNMVVSSRGDDGSIIPVADYSFGVSEDKLFVARFAEEEQQENNGDKATIQIQTNGEVGLYKIPDLNGNSEGIDPTDSLELVDNATGEVTGYIYTYECNVGESIQLLANVHTTETFYGWYGNYADTEFDELTDDFFSSEWLLGNVTMVDDEPEYSYEYSFKVTKTTNRFVAIFDEEVQQPTGATIQVKTNGEIQLTVDGKSLEAKETSEGDGYTTYTFTCEKGDNVTFTASRGKRQEFMGWWDEEYFNRYDYHYQDEPYMGKGDIIIEEGDREAEYKKKTEEFHEQHCVGGFSGEYPDYVYNLEFDSTIVEDSYTFIADFYTISSETIDGVAYSITDEDAKTCKVSSVDKELATINIPAKVSIGGEEFSVTSIGKRSFDYCKCSEVIIPEGVTTIEDDAFYFCDNITSLSLPNTISFVGNSAFRGGFDNFQYYKENGVSYLGNSENPYVVLMDYNYNNNPNTNIVIPEGCCYIYQSAFYNSAYGGERPIGGVTIPNTVKGIGCNAFYSQTITTLVIPEGVTYIDEMAFYSCSKLTSVSIPSSLDYVGQNAFYFEANDLSYYIDGNAKYLGNKDNNYVYLVQATQNDITSCEINDNCKLIGALAFSECTSLSSVTIPGSVKSIGGHAFYGCTGLVNLDVPDGVRFIGVYAFQSVININYHGDAYDNGNWGAQTRNCLVDGDFAYSDETKTTLVKYIGNDDEVIIPNTVKTIGVRAFYDPNITNVTIPSSVTTIGDYAFYCNNNFKLKALTVPESVTAIGSYAFNSIMNVVYNGTAEPNEGYDGANWGAQNLNAPMDENFIYADDGKTILQFIGTGTEIDIPNTVTTIAPGAFSASEITSVNIPSSVTEIGESAFGYCSSLESVSIPASVTKIGKNAFRGSGLNSVRFESVADLCRIAFANEYSNPMYHWENADVSLYFGDEQKAIQSVEIPNTMDSIGQYAFYNCKQLTSVSIPASVKRIGANAFGRCNNISRVTIAEPDGNNGLQEIGYKAFNECAFPTIVLPNTLTTIGNNAFDNCDNLVSVVIPESVISMGNYVFSYIEHNVVIFCLETGDSDIARYEGWGDYWDSALDYNSDVKIAVVKENRNAEEPNIVRGDNGLLYFIYRYDASEETSNINEDALQNLTSETNFTATNGEAILIGYRDNRSSDGFDLAIPGEIGDDSKALRSEVVAIARYAFYRENISSLTIGDDGSKAATPKFNLRFIGRGAFCNAWLATLTMNGDESGTWYKYNYAEGGDAQKVTNMNANELTTNSCENEFYRDILPQTFFVQPEREGSDCDGSEEKPFRYFAQAINAIKNSCKNGYTDFTIRFALQEGGNKKSYMGDSIANGYGDPSNLGFAGHMRTLAGQNARVTIDFSNVEFQYFVAGTFSGLKNLVGVVLPEGIAMIPDSAFFDCSNLDSVNIPSSVASIGRYAFGKTNLTADDFTIPDVSGETWFRHKLINAPDVWSADDLVDDIDDLKESLAANTDESSEEYGYAYYRNKTEFIHVGVGGYSDIENAIYSSNMFHGEESKNIKYVFYIDGTLNSNQTLPSNLGTENGDYYAKSILIMGSGTDAKIDAGWRADGSGTDNNMPALAIYTNVPVTIKNLTITGGSAEYGGGVYAGANSDLTIADGTVIENNNAYYGGGGVLVCEDGKLTVTGGKIADNRAGGSGQGGGVYIQGTAIISGGEISNNISAQFGGGVYVGGSANVTINGNVVIKSNSATQGSGIYVSGNLQWGGAATVEGDNDIYLCSGKYITITEELDCEDNEIVATITPYSYDEVNLQVVSTDESLELDYADSHFAITPDSESNTYHLVNGYMVKD